MNPRVKRLASIAGTLALGAGLVAWWTSGWGSPPSTPPPDPMVYEGAEDARNPMALLGGDPSGADRLLAPSGARPMDRPPAGLPVYEDARRWIGFRRADGGWVEETGVWSIDGADAAEVRAFYEAAAERDGFEPREAAKRSEHTRWFVRGGRVLMVRARPAADGTVRLTLILRYTGADSEE